MRHGEATAHLATEDKGGEDVKGQGLICLAASSRVGHCSWTRKAVLWVAGK